MNLDTKVCENDCRASSLSHVQLCDQSSVRGFLPTFIFLGKLVDAVPSLHRAWPPAMVRQCTTPPPSLTKLTLKYSSSPLCYLLSVYIRSPSMRSLPYFFYHHYLCNDQVLGPLVICILTQVRWCWHIIERFQPVWWCAECVIVNLRVLVLQFGRGNLFIKAQDLHVILHTHVFYIAAAHTPPPFTFLSVLTL